MVCEDTPEDELTEQREQRYKLAYNLCRVVTEEEESQLFYTYCDEGHFQQYPEY